MSEPELRLSVRPGKAGGIHATVARAREAEAAGFDQIWLGNDIFDASGVVALSAIAAATSRIHLGTSVLDTVSLHPAQIAMIAAGLQELSGGRFLLGLGAGSDVFFGFAGLTPPSPVRRTREALVAVQHLLAGRSPAGDPDAGDGWTDKAVLRDPPEVAPPVYVGAMGPKMLQMTGRFADGALPLCLPPERFVRARAEIDKGAAAAGRDLDRFDLAACIWCSIDDDAERGRRRLAEFIARYSGSLSVDALVEEGFDPDEFARVQRLVLDEGTAAGADAVTADMMRLGIAGGPGDVLEQCAALLAAGARHISFGPPFGPDVNAAMHVLGAKVLPELRAAD